MSPAKPGKPDTARHRGQALVEFALVLPVFFVLVFGLVDGARLVFSYNTVAQAARNAARVAAVEAPFIGKVGAACTAPVCPVDVSAYRADVVAAANKTAGFIGAVPDDNASLSLDCHAFGTAPGGTPNNCASGNISGAVVTVKLDLSIEPLTPFWGPFYPSQLGATSTMVLP